MNDLDLSGVPPMRWQEVRRRVSAVRDYLALTKPEPMDTERFAKQVGLSIDQFERLVRSWRLHSSPARLDGAGSLFRDRRSRSDGLDEEVQAVIAKAIKSAKIEASPKEVYERIVSECEDRGLAIPSNNLVWARLMEAKSQARPKLTGDAEVLVGRAWLQLPVTSSSGHDILTRPELLVAIQMPEQRIVAWRTDLETKRPPLFEDLDLSDALLPVIKVSPLDMRVPCQIAGTIVHDKRANTRVTRILGDNIGGIGIALRLPRTSASRLLTNKLDRPLGPDDAQLAITHAIKRYNSRSGKTS